MSCSLSDSKLWGNFVGPLLVRNGRILNKGAKTNNPFTVMDSIDFSNSLLNFRQLAANTGL